MNPDLWIVFKGDEVLGTHFDYWSAKRHIDDCEGWDGDKSKYRIVRYGCMEQEWP